MRVTTETKRATRHRLLESAAAEFARAGLQRASVDEISLAAGLAKGTVYNYFGSKEELFLAVVEEACARAADAGAPAEAPYVDELTAILTVGAERGEVRRDTPAETLALALAGLADLALVRCWASGASTPRLDEIPELVVSLFLDGAGPRTAPGP